MSAGISTPPAPADQPDRNGQRGTARRSSPAARTRAAAAPVDEPADERGETPQADRPARSRPRRRRVPVVATMARSVAVSTKVSARRSPRRSSAPAHCSQRRGSAPSQPGPAASSSADRVGGLSRKSADPRQRQPDADGPHGHRARHRRSPQRRSTRRADRRSSSTHIGVEREPGPVLVFGHHGRHALPDQPEDRQHQQPRRRRTSPTSAS